MGMHLAIASEKALSYGEKIDNQSFNTKYQHQRHFCVMIDDDDVFRCFLSAWFVRPREKQFRPSSKAVDKKMRFLYYKIIIM